MLSLDKSLHTDVLIVLDLQTGPHKLSITVVLFGLKTFLSFMRSANFRQQNQCKKRHFVSHVFFVYLNIFG